MTSSHALKIATAETWIGGMALPNLIIEILEAKKTYSEVPGIAVYLDSENEERRRWKRVFLSDYGLI